MPAPGEGAVPRERNCVLVEAQGFDRKGKPIKFSYVACEVDE